MKAYPNKRRRFPHQHRGNSNTNNRHHPRNPPGRGRAGPVVDTSRIEERGTSDGPNTISIAVLGCCHGELGAVYDRIEHHQKETGRNVDLLVCCGDFQSLRTWADFHSLAVPPKYRNSLGSFLPYYVGEKHAPVPTIVIGGNHEASQSLQELYYGGWLAPRIYYLGAAGVVRFRGLRIGGLSGIFKEYSFRKPHWERPPYNPANSLRSVYHVRQVDVARLLSLSPPKDAQDAAEGELDRRTLGKRLDIMLTHDWPQGIEHHGDLQGLLRKKPFFRNDIQNNELGNPAGRDILLHLKPRHWFAAHLHVKFEATLHHENKKLSSVNPSTAEGQLTPSQVITASPKKDETQASTASAENNQGESMTTSFLASESRDPCSPPDLTEQMTKFLALDKCLPRKPYLSIVHVQSPNRVSEDSDSELGYDSEWLAILKKTHNWTSTNTASPIVISKSDTEEVERQLGTLVIPHNFTPTLSLLSPSASLAPVPNHLPPPLPHMGNPQTDRLLQLLGLDHCTSGLTLPFTKGLETAGDVDPNAIDIETGDTDPNAIAIEQSAGNPCDDGNEIDIDEL